MRGFSCPSLVLFQNHIAISISTSTSTMRREALGAAGGPDGAPGPGAWGGGVGVAIGDRVTFRRPEYAPPPRARESARIRLRGMRQGDGVFAGGTGHGAGRGAVRAGSYSVPAADLGG